jgi:DNA-binding CsgD family transcriptional regulator
MSGNAKNIPVARLTDETWFRQTGRVAMSVGRDTFYRELINLFGSTIKHDSSWIMRYSRFAPPDVLYTHNVPDDIVRLYTRECFSIDPFSNHWKTRGTPGVLTLSSLKAENVEFIIYSKIFGGAANISDEMAMFFTTVGHCCLALFLIRENGIFSAADKKRAELIFPALDGYHHAHLSWLFNGLRYTETAEMEGFIKRPTLIQDRFQEQVYANHSWTKAAAADPAIGEIVRAAFADSTNRKYDLDEFILRSEALDRYFPLAPGGRIFVLEPRFAAQSESAHVDQVAAALDNFTRREREILALILIGQNTGQIAQKLQISKGTIKNCRLRIYRKADVTSERALVNKFVAIFKK